MIKLQHSEILMKNGLPYPVGRGGKVAREGNEKELCLML